MRKRKAEKCGAHGTRRSKTAEETKRGERTESTVALEREGTGRFDEERKRAACRSNGESRRWEVTESEVPETRFFVAGK